MRVGRYTVTLHDHGSFRLDGGAMFGAVPKAIWERLCPPDERNRILMATRSLVVEDDAGRKLIVDLGCGDKWAPKTRDIFGISDCPYAPVGGVTHVLLTHLHFDHCGGVSRWTESLRGAPDIQPNYPSARHFVSRANLENAKSPNPRERASYLRENWSALDAVQLTLVERSGVELPDWPGLRVHRSDGHTQGLLWVELSGDGDTIVFPSDLCPTSHHLPLAYAMGYDMCAETEMREKEEFLRAAIEGKWVVIFEHDPEIAAARLGFDAHGKARVAEIVNV